ncbi:MAG TPA: glycosyltransferase family 2 protein [Candidatus Saccharimonadales bacterium]|nr:glycosyltransferase family 2 protein [Candidatus Saccharimonadales bacterium]
MSKERAITIVIPVYADWPSLKNCLAALKETVDLSRDKVMLVNDNGPEADEIEKNIEKFITGTKGFSYYRNPKNLGFVGTCNRAVQELDKSGNDVLLLNSDTKPTVGWLDEMRAVLALSSKHGVVSPRSNNATITTVPLSSASQKGIEPEKSYEVFKKISLKLPRFNIVPVGHGFCMLIRREPIDEYGLFDKIFGKGYGEEVDFCQRIRAHGYQSVLANRAYVFHLEARSFTHATKAQLLEKNNEIIWSRYPNYRQDVRDYMSSAVDRESEIERRAGVASPASRLKRLVKKNPVAHGVARKILRR